MMRFLFGNDTEAKNQKMLDLVRAALADGDEALLLVPEQETVTVERRMVEALPPAAQLSFEVSNFSRLANRILLSLCYQGGKCAGHVAHPARDRPDAHAIRRPRCDRPAPLGANARCRGAV